VIPKKKEKYSGAIDCLSQVYAEKGFAGWYQVRSSVSFIPHFPSDW
jgi:hypothetical protein